MKLSKYDGLRVGIIDIDGQVFEGKAEYCYPEDNENGKESIVIETKTDKFIEFWEEDIKTISVI